MGSLRDYVPSVTHRYKRRPSGPHFCAFKGTVLPYLCLTNKILSVMRKLLLIAFAFALVMILGTGEELLAQCPMCRATAETNLANGGTEGRGLNQGILYLLGMPYVLIGAVAFFWWRGRKNIDEEELVAE
jgi:hypothetical protein